MHHRINFSPHFDKKMVFFLTFLLLGILITIQSRSVLKMSKEKTTTAMRIEIYNKELAAEKKKSELLKKQITENEKNKEEFLKEFSKDSKVNSYMNELGNELERTKLAAGLTEVKGKGIIIKMNDAPARETDHPEYLIIHDSDVVGICNELKKAGAQAISVSGERIISSSELICAGPTIKINKNRYPVPFEIKAIGDPDKLAEGVDNSRIVSEMRDFNITVEITKSDEVLVEKYNYKIEDLITSLEVAK